MKPHDRLKLTILMPVYNDMDVAKELIKQLDAVIDSNLINATVIIVDDGSIDRVTPDFKAQSLKNISAVDILTLHRNIGHQRAIAVGLTAINENFSYDAVIVMDADGEDKPEDVPRLISKFLDSKMNKIVFAERLKRSEGIIFKISYKAYQFIHSLLIGIAVRVGNFSIVPSKHVSALVLVSELWNHYAAAVFISRLPYITIPTKRGDRISGKSTMNFTALVIHGLSAISVFSSIAGVRLLLFTFFLFFLLISIIIFITVIKLTSIIVIPGWISLSTIFMLILLLQVFSGCFAMIFFILMNRNNSSFLPKRDCKHFIESLTRIYG